MNKKLLITRLKTITVMLLATWFLLIAMQLYEIVSYGKYIHLMIIPVIFVQLLLALAKRKERRAKAQRS